MLCPYGDIVLITGASSGIGKTTALFLAEKGFTVYGTSRKENPAPLQADGEGSIHMIQMDVTNDQSVQRAVDAIIKETGRIDVVVNCAGIGISGAVEDCSAQEAQEQLNTNYCGVIRVLQAVLPHMRERKNGLIVNIGSVGGLFSIPFQTLYSSSKYALEALTEGLRIELKPWNVKAALVEPGDTKTGFTNSRMFAKKALTSPYRTAMSRAVGRMIHDELNGMEALSVTKTIFSLMKKRNPPIRKVVGFSYRCLVFAKRLLPSRLVESVLANMYTSPKLPTADEYLVQPKNTAS